jgi:hypothetical protein
VGLERGQLSLVSIIEELLEWKSSGSVSRKTRLTAVGILCADHATPSYQQKLVLTSATGGGLSVGIVHLWTKVTEFSSYCIVLEMQCRILWKCLDFENTLIVWMFDTYVHPFVPHWVDVNCHNFNLNYKHV